METYFLIVGAAEAVDGKRVRTWGGAQQRWCSRRVVGIPAASALSCPMWDTWRGMLAWWRWYSVPRRAAQTCAPEAPPAALRANQRPWLFRHQHILGRCGQGVDAYVFITLSHLERINSMFHIGKYHLLLSTSALVVQINLKSWFTSLKKIWK
jgi:hypothetical protein